jgi:hypothetical protein
MPKIDKLTIDKIMDAARIEEVIQECLGSYEPNNPNGLKKSGVRYKALCPFHDDRSMGSFIVYPKGNCYKCFSCGAKGGVIEWLMEHEKLSYPDALRWLGRKYSIPVDDVPVDWTYVPKPAPPPLPTLHLPVELMLRTQYALNLTTENDNLVRWICHGIKWDSVQLRRIQQVLADYHVGHGNNGHTIFWQLDENGHIRTGKMMKYREDGHRDKQASWNFDWIHSSLERGTPQRDDHGQIMRDEHGDVIYNTDAFRHLYDTDRQEARITFFGMHLTQAMMYRHATIKLVESEKTAILMAIAYGNSASDLWIACGGLEMLTRERLKPLTDQGRRIILYPDRDGIDKWKAKVASIGYDRLSIDTDPVLKWWRPEDGDKAAIADVVVRMLNNSKPLTTIQDVAREMPQAKPLIDKLNLEIQTDESE